MNVQIVCSVNDLSDVGVSRRQAVALAAHLGFNETDAARVALIVTELATNLVRHAGRGQLLLQRVQNENFQQLEVLSVDSGPGMRDVEQCLRDGYSTAGTAGTGLGAVRRLSSEFEIFTAADKGCVVMSRMQSSLVKGTTRQTRWRWGVISVPAPGENVVGDSWRIVPSADDMAVMLADGLGHGPLASKAAEAAAVVFENVETRGGLTTFFNRAHEALRPTRGAAIAAAYCSADGPSLTYAGAGNIAGSILSRDGRTRGLMSHNGTVGAEMRALRELPYPWNAGDRLVMHSDGLLSRWSVAGYSGLSDRHPAIISAVLYRDFLRGRDDATVLVLERAA